MRGRPRHFLFDQKKALLPHTSLEIMFNLANSDVYLKKFTDDDIKIKITDMYLDICRQRLWSSSYNRIQQVLRHTPAKYPLLNRKEMRYHNIPSGTTSYSAPGVFSGLSPKQLVIGFLEGANITGDPTKSAFDFKNVGVKEIYTEKNGFKVPYESYNNLDFKNALVSGSALHPFMQVSQLGQKQQYPTNLNISYVDYVNNGFTLYVFDYSPDSNESTNSEDYITPTNNSALNVFVTFDTENNHGTKTPLHMVLFAMYDSLLEIDNNGMCNYNWV
jgi:hypothetical protein